MRVMFELIRTGWRVRTGSSLFFVALGAAAGVAPGCLRPSGGRV
jgi:hypothetical protein